MALRKMDRADVPAAQPQGRTASPRRAVPGGSGRGGIPGPEPGDDQLTREGEDRRLDSGC